MTTLSLRPALCLAALALVSACGGTTIPVAANDLPRVPTQNDPRLSLSEIKSVQNDIKPLYDAVGVTPKAQVPTFGGARYLGYVQGNMAVPGNRTDVSGVMEMGVDFDRDQVGGVVGNLVTSQGAPIDGQLRLSNGRLNRTLNSTQVTILSDVGGTLRTGAGETVTVNGAVTRGGFKGANGQFAGVPMTGTIRVDDGRTSQPGTFDLTGILAR